MTTEEELEKAKQFAVQIRLLEQQYKLYLGGNLTGNVNFFNGTGDKIFSLEQISLSCIEPDFSCVVLFCDKDVHYIPALIKNINDNMDFAHEIILVDNRDDQSTSLCFDGATVISEHQGNTRQVEARKYAAQFCKGKYIWFIDADDEILPIYRKKYEDILAKQFDVYAFPYLLDDGREINLNIKNGLINDFKNYETYHEIEVMNWNKWYKRELFQEVATHIPEGTRITASEDCMYVLLCLKYANSLYCEHTPIYKYNLKRSSISQKGVRDFQQFEWITYGYNEVNTIIHKNFSVEENARFKLHKLELYDCAFFLNKYYETEDENTKILILRKIIKMFSFETIIESVFTEFITFQSYNSAYKVLSELNKIKEQQYVK